jgi:hypothetical protein
MKIYDIIPLGDGVYELEKGFSDRKLDDGDLANFLFGGIEAAFAPPKPIENADVL